MTSVLERRHEIALGMSNFAHQIDGGLAEALRADPLAFAQYSGWNFVAYVCADPDGPGFLAEVHVRHRVIKTIQAPNLEDVMDNVSAEFGWR
jgi:hypothetical protein